MNADAKPLESTEVDQEDNLKENQGGGGSPVPTKKPVADSHDDVIDTIVPKAEPKTWVINDGKQQREYVQRPLSFFGKMNFFSLVGEVIDKAVSGDDGLRISSLFEAPGGRDGILSASDFKEADTFVQGVGKLLIYAPDFLEKCYAIWLDIPDHERLWAIDVMRRSTDSGGLSDQDGMEIIEVFIDQNWDSLDDFFRKKIVTLRGRIQSHRPEKEEETTDE